MAHGHNGLRHVAVSSQVAHLNFCFAEGGERGSDIGSDNDGNSNNDSDTVA